MEVSSTNIINYVPQLIQPQSNQSQGSWQQNAINTLLNLVYLAEQGDRNFGQNVAQMEADIQALEADKGKLKTAEKNLLGKLEVLVGVLQDIDNNQTPPPPFNTMNLHDIMDMVRDTSYTLIGDLVS